MSSERFIEHVVAYPALSDKAMKELFYSEWLFEEECRAIFNAAKVYESVQYNCISKGIQLKIDEVTMGQMVEDSDFMIFILKLGCNWYSKETIGEYVTKHLKSVFIARNEEAIAEKLAKLAVCKAKKHVDDGICYYLVREAVERCYEFIADEKSLYRKEINAYDVFMFLKKENEHNSEVSDYLLLLSDNECCVKYIYKLSDLGYKASIKNRYDGYLDKTKETLCIESPNGNIIDVASHWTKEEATKVILKFIDKLNK